MNAVAYIRVSGASQIDGDGPERQAHSTTDFAASHGITLDIDPRQHITDGIVENYPFFDAGVSGTKGWAHRPGLLAAFQYCDEHSINTILAENSDRITRDLTVGFEIIGECVRRGIRLIACDTGIDLTKPTGSTGRLIRQVLFAVAEHGKNSFVERTRESRQRIKKRTGKCEGQKALRELPAFKATINRMKELREQGLGYEHIATTLQQEGFPTRNGGQWRASTVWQNLNG